MSEIFKDLISEEALKDAKNRVYPIRRTFYKMEEEVAYSTEGLGDLLNSIKRAQISTNENKDDREYVEKIKKELDKVVYLLEEFTQEFKPIYEDISTLYVAEKLAGTFDEDGDIVLSTDGFVPTFRRENKGWKSK